MKIQNNSSFAEAICDLRIRKNIGEFFGKIAHLLSWSLIIKIVDKYYIKGYNVVGMLIVIKVPNLQDVFTTNVVRIERL